MQGWLLGGFTATKPPQNLNQKSVSAK